jgi:[protein-PII] uridylyltransferase
VSTANPSAMTAWNARMLVELWLSVSDVIEGRREGSDYVESLREHVLRLAVDASERERVAAFLSQLPERYLLANSAADVLHHQRLADARGSDALVEVRKTSHEDSLEVVIVTDDRPGLLADLTAALALQRYDVVSAQLFTRRHDARAHEAVDIFHVSPRDGIASSDIESDSARLTKTIAQLVSGASSAESLLNRRSQVPSWVRVGPRIKTEIGVDNEASKTHTVVDVYTRDRPELLYTIAHTLHSHGLTIALAKVNTEGRRVADVFYVQSASGGKLVPGQLAKLSQALRETIGKLDS